MPDGDYEIRNRDAVESHLPGWRVVAAPLQHLVVGLQSLILPSYHPMGAAEHDDGRPYTPSPQTFSGLGVFEKKRTPRMLSPSNRS